MSNSQKILLAQDTTAHCFTPEPSGELLQMNGVDYYKIEHYDRLQP
ncbi:MAG: hypothetical protein GF350_08830, partial [Chitinivibrionales bacterium]|nr:hypothetical protein [Chitinivibrionales bacterium]